MGILSSKLKKYVPNGYHSLQRVRKITNEDLEANPKWSFLKGEYEAVEANHPNNDWMHWLIPPLINSILYQERVYFVLSRDQFRNQVIKEDQNWTIERGRTGFGNSKWSPFLEYLKEEGFIVHYNEGSNNTNIYKVVHPELLKYLKINENEQLQACLEYSENEDEKANDNERLALSQVRDELRDELRDQDISNKIEDISKPKLITLEKLLFNECPDNFVFGEDITRLAQIAVERCEDFDGGSSDISTFRKHFEGQDGRLTPKRKNTIKDMCNKFEREARKAIALIEMEGVEISEPREIQRKSIINSMDKEEKAQGYTLNVLAASFGPEKIKQLKKRLDQTDDETERQQIELELNHWEKIV